MSSGSQSHRGSLYGLGAYLLWGAFPLYFPLLEPAGPVEIVAHRVVWSLVVCAVVMTATRGWGQVGPLLHSGRTTAAMAAAAVLIAVNWGVYIAAVNSGQVVEAALGYFINPLVTVLLGVAVLRERLRVLQWAAIAVGALAVLVLSVGYGRVPWIALTLASSFGLYGLVKNRVGRSVGALASLTFETMLLAPVAAVTLAVLQASGAGSLTTNGAGHVALLASSGVATAAPLLLFAAAARRVPLSTIGLLQYLTPVLQFGCGVFLLGEQMAPARWWGFAIVWVALVILTADMLRAGHQSRRSRNSAPIKEFAVDQGVRPALRPSRDDPAAQPPWPPAGPGLLDRRRSP